MLRLIAAFALVPLSYASAAEPATTSAPPPASEKLICKRQVETGSLVKRKKECHTRAEWQQIADANNRNAQQFIENMGGRPSCPSPDNPLC